MKTLLPVLVGVTLMLASAAGSTQDVDKDVLKLSIERKSLRDALNDWAQQTGYQLIAEIRGDYVAPEVEGRLTAQEALDRLLKGTPLTYQWMSERLVAVREKSQVVPAALSAPGKKQTAIRVAQLSGDEPERVRLAADDQPVAQNDQGSRNERRARDAESDIEGLEVIVVTAQKRIERLIDTPQSVSVLSADALASLGATQFRDFANTVPGLSFTTAGAGNTQVTLRGVTIGQDLGATVGTYVDETPYGSSSVFALGPYLALDVGLFDIDRIEVLRGPQGTLYGASTMGGLIKYVTKRPNAEQFTGSLRTGVSGTEGGGTNYDVAGVVNIPLAANKAAMRASIFQSHDAGYIDNVALGQDDVNRSDIYGGRLDFLFTPTEHLDIRITGFLQNVGRDGEATANYAFSGAKPLGSLSQHRPFEEPFDQRFRLVSGTIVYDFDWASLTSISTYQTARTEYTWDISAAFAPLLNSFGFGPYSAIAAPTRSNTDKFTQEVRLAAQTGKRVEWVIGGFYTREKSDLFQTFLEQDLAGNPSPDNLFTYLAPTVFKESAVFGDLTLRLTDKFDITGGIRYARNDQEFTQFGSGPLGANVPTRRSDEDVFTYLGSARYHLNDHATAYVRYATGYRPGGPNIVTTATQTPTFDSDSLKSYEAGIKAETANRRFALDLSGYYIDWNDIQLSVNIGGFTSYLNALGGASVRGAELALTGRPASGLTLTGTFAYQDAHLDDADPNLGGAKGERLPNVARFTSALNADYEFSNAGLQPRFGTTLRYVGDRRSSFDASQGFPQYRLPDYTAVDLRGGLTFGKFDTQLYIHNLTDERGQLSLMFAQFGARVAILQPRTIGVSVTTQF